MKKHDWSESIPSENGFYWCVDLADEDRNVNLIEVNTIGGILIGRGILSVRWSILSDWDGFAFSEQIQVPPECTL